jgi:hypothetical protein
VYDVERERLEVDRFGNASRVLELECVYAPMNDLDDRFDWLYPR